VKEDSPGGGGRDGISRRQVLKLGSAAVMLASTGAAGLRLSGGVPAQAATADPPFLARNFRVDIDGMPAASANCMAVEIDPVRWDVRETTTGIDVEYRTYAPGDAHYGRVKVKFPWLGSDETHKEILSWLEDARTGKNIRKNISIYLLKKDGSPGRTYNLLECFPIKYDPGDYSPSSTTPVQTLEIQIGRLEIS
jgi:phage tail-like protein